MGPVCTLSRDELQGGNVGATHVPKTALLPSSQGCSRLKPGLKSVVPEEADTLSVTSTIRGEKRAWTICRSFSWDLIQTCDRSPGTSRSSCVNECPGMQNASVADQG